MISILSITIDQFPFCLYLENFSRNYFSVQSFDCQSSLKVRGIFLDISKAFDRVWNKGLLHKIQFIGISGTPLKLVEKFKRSGRYQSVLLNDTTSFWSPILTGVPQGSILEPLLF